GGPSRRSGGDARGHRRTARRANLAQRHQRVDRGASSGVVAAAGRRPGVRAGPAPPPPRVGAVANRGARLAADHHRGAAMSSMYGDEHRELQDRFDSRALADTLAAVTVMPALDEAAKAFIASRSFFFLSTVDGDGQPTVSYKGGAPGFVRVVDDTTIVFPSYDGNGMFLSMGNIAGQGRIGLLFIDFETPHRIRVHAEAELVTEGDLLDTYPGADLVVRATITQSF